jgi:hypothetical protein
LEELESSSEPDTRDSQRMATTSILSSARMLFNNAPDPITIDKIESTTDIKYLIQLEKEYDHFIEYESDLRYYDHVLNECLEIREHIKMRIDKLVRIDLLRKHYLDHR